MRYKMRRTLPLRPSLHPRNGDSLWPRGIRRPPASGTAGPGRYTAYPKQPWAVRSICSNNTRPGNSAALSSALCADTVGRPGAAMRQERAVVHVHDFWRTSRQLPPANPILRAARPSALPDSPDVGIAIPKHHTASASASPASVERRGKPESPTPITCRSRAGDTSDVEGGRPSQGALEQVTYFSNCATARASLDCLVCTCQLATNLTLGIALLIVALTRWTRRVGRSEGGVCERGGGEQVSHPPLLGIQDPAAGSDRPTRWRARARVGPARGRKGWSGHRGSCHCDCRWRAGWRGWGCHASASAADSLVCAE